MKLQYMCLDSVLDLCLPGHFEAFLMNVENLEIDNSLKCVLFIKVSSKITSDTLRK